MSSQINPPSFSHAHPHTLPSPTLTPDFSISVRLNPKISVGSTPSGQRNWISFYGGTWTARWGRGTVEPGGQDSQVVMPESLFTKVETHYLLKTDDEVPAYIIIKTSGWRTGPRSVLKKLFDPVHADAVRPEEYSFRLFVSMETGDERYREKVNDGMWVGSGARFGAEVVYDAYRVG